LLGAERKRLPRANAFLAFTFVRGHQHHDAMAALSAKEHANGDFDHLQEIIFGDAIGTAHRVDVRIWHDRLRYDVAFEGEVLRVCHRSVERR
jgi:hypothetical protein